MPENPDIKGILNIDNMPVNYYVWINPAYLQYDLFYDPDTFISVLQNAGYPPSVIREGNIDMMHVNRCVWYLNDHYGLELPEV